MKCPFCGTDIEDDSLFCPICGNKVEKIQQAKALDGEYCPFCGAFNPADSDFCCQCGQNLNGQMYAGGAVKKMEPRQDTSKTGVLAAIIVALVLVILAIAVGLFWFFIIREDTYQDDERIKNERLIDEDEDSDVDSSNNEEAEEQEKAEAEKIEEEKAEKEKAEKEKAEREKAAAEKAEKEKAAAEKAEAASYILSQSSTTTLSASDISGLSLKELNYARNEIFARHGRKFASQELQNYFNSKSWYSGTIEPGDFDANYMDTLSAVEKRNIELLKNTEYSLAPSGYLLDQ